MAATKQSIWKAFFILFGLTAVEFIIAFTVKDPDMVMMRNIVYITLTIAKAFFIVAEFMHMKYEVKALVMSVMIPFMFIIWFIVAMLVEGEWWNGGWFSFLNV